MGVGAQEVNVKCRAMYARLLKRGDYDALLAMKSVSQIAAYLKKQTTYAYVLRRIDENEVHRGQLEQVFKRSLFYDYERLLKFTAGSCKAAIRAMFESFEIDDLKLIIGSVCSDHEQFLTGEDLIYSRTYSRYPTELLLAADTMEGLVENLRGTRYYKPLLPFAVRENPDYLRIDHALNLLNFRTGMGVFQKTLRGDDRKTAVALYSTRADLENILFIYRIKKLYSLPASEIIRCLLPCEYKVSARELLDLANCGGIDELTDKINGTFYGFLFPKGRESEWEALQAKYFCDMHKKNIRLFDGGVNAAFAYLYLKELDIKNIVIIIEGVRYSLPPDMITPFLTGYGA